MSPGGAGTAGGSHRALQPGQGGQGGSGDWQSLLGRPGRCGMVTASPSFSAAPRGRSRSHPAPNQGTRSQRGFVPICLTRSRTVLQELVRATTWGRKAVFQAMGSNIHETLIFNSEPLE